MKSRKPVYSERRLSETNSFEQNLTDEKIEKIQDNKFSNQALLKKQFIELRAAGFTHEDIASKLGISLRTLTRWNSKFKQDIESVRNVRLTELLSDIIQSKKSDNNYLRSLYDKIKNNIENSEILMRFDDMVKLLILLSDKINKNQLDIFLLGKK